MGNPATSKNAGITNRIVLHEAAAALPVPSGAPVAGLLAPWRVDPTTEWAWAAGALLRIRGSDAALTVGGPIAVNLCDDEDVWDIAGQILGGADLVGVSVTRGYVFKLKDCLWAKAIALNSGAIVGGVVTVTIEPLLLRKGE